MPKKMAHAATKVHRNAERVVDYLIAQNGHSTESNVEIAAALGMTQIEYQEATRHTVSCGLLGDFIVAFRSRKKGSEVVLFEPTAKATLNALTDRTDPAFMGWRRLRDAWFSARTRMVATIETAAREAYSDGQNAVGDALTHAAKDINLYGEVQPSTEALLRIVKAIA